MIIKCKVYESIEKWRVGHFIFLEDENAEEIANTDFLQLGKCLGVYDFDYNYLNNVLYAVKTSSGITKYWDASVFI